VAPISRRVTCEAIRIRPPDINTHNGEGSPYVVPDGSALYFHVIRNGNYDVYRAKKTPTGFTAPESVSINTSVTDARPVVSADELTVYFYHDAEARGPAGIWMATRRSVNDPFGQLISLVELNAFSSLIENPYPFWISPDGCRLYFGDEDPQGSFWVYVAERLD